MFELIEGRNSLACFSRQDSRKLRSALIDTASICYIAAFWFCYHWNPTKILATLNSMLLHVCFDHFLLVPATNMNTSLTRKGSKQEKSYWFVNIVIAFCKLWGSHCNVNENSGVLWCDTMSFGKLVTDVSGVSIISLCLHGWVVQEEKELIALLRLIRPRI